MCFLESFLRLKICLKDLYLEGHSGSSEFGDVNLVAVYMPCWAYDMVKVTVIEVDLDGRFGYGSQMDDDDVRHSDLQGSSDTNGKISWDDANGDRPGPKLRLFSQ